MTHTIDETREVVDGEGVPADAEVGEAAVLKCVGEVWFELQGAFIMFDGTRVILFFLVSQSCAVLQIGIIGIMLGSFTVVAQGLGIVTLIAVGFAQLKILFG